MPNGLAGLHWNLKRIEGEVDEIRDELRALRREFQDYRKEEVERQKVERKAREAKQQSDFRWRVTTFIGISGVMLIAAQIVRSAL